MLAIFASIVTVSLAIIYRPDKDASLFRVGTSTTQSAFGYQNVAGEEGYNCSGSVIGPRHAISAAHCFGDNQAAFTATINGSTYTVGQVRKHNCWDGEGPNSADLAILVFTSDVTGFTIPTVFEGTSDEEEVGQQITIAGWGSYGAGNQNISEEDYTD